MGFLPDVYICFTTIPSRLTGSVKSVLDSHMRQTYAQVKGILLTVPRENMRGMTVSDTLPPWLDTQPYASKVTVLRPQKDHGPIMKYLGGRTSVPQDAWAFVCDDDQCFSPDCIDTWVKLIGRKDVPASVRSTHVHNPSSLKSGVQYSWAHMEGYQGLLVSRQFLDMVHREFDPSLPQFCLRVDDDLVSLYARDNGYVKVIMPDKLIRGSVRNPDALSRMYDRDRDRHQTHALCNSKYLRNLETGTVLFAGLTCVSATVLIIAVYFLCRRRSAAA